MICANFGRYALNNTIDPTKTCVEIRKVGIVCGKHHLYHRDIYKSKHQWIRFVLYALWHNIPILPTLPEHRVCIQTRWSKGMAKALGYYQYAGYIVRADVIDTIRWQNSNPVNINRISSKLGLPLAESQKIVIAMGIMSKDIPSSPKKRKKSQ